MTLIGQERIMDRVGDKARVRSDMQESWLGSNLSSPCEAKPQRKIERQIDRYSIDPEGISKHPVIRHKFTQYKIKIRNMKYFDKLTPRNFVPHPHPI